MFGWFGKQNLTPDDVNKGMLTSNFVCFKIGEKLIIPNNVICFVRYKDKTYKELPTETYSLNKELLLDLYTKQLKGKKKIKKLKADLYFVNLAPFNLDFEYVDKVPINNVLTKLLFNINVNVSVNNANAFSKFIIYENTAASSFETEQIVINFIESIIKKFYLKRKLNSNNLNNELKQELFAFAQKQLNKVGIDLNSLDVAIHSKSSNKEKSLNKNSNFFNDKTQQPNESVEDEELKNLTTSTNKLDQTEEISYTEHTNENVCPNCKSKLIKGSIFCHKCGYRK